MPLHSFPLSTGPRPLSTGAPHSRAGRPFLRQSRIAGLLLWLLLWVLLPVIGQFYPASIALAQGVQPLVAVAAAEPAPGEALYARRCGACHSLDKNRVGPRHRNLAGREAGSLPDYNYSPALAASDLIWSAVTLERWLRDPEALIPGQRMGYRLGNAEERAAIIAFLLDGGVSN